MDAGEDPRQAAERECLEETGLKVRAGELLDVIAGQEHSRGAHLFIVYRAEPLMGEVRGADLQAADDADRVGFFPLENLPPLAFTTTRKVLAHLNKRQA
jgi:ADP-ribose pyrophosphatase YjhB (NUDIX family)